MKTGSYSEDGMPLVANLELDCQLIRHATWFHLRDEHGTSIARSETVPRGVVHLHAIRIDRPTLVRHFTHRRGQGRLVLESHERVGEYFDGYSHLSHEEYFDLARERGYPARSIEFE
ncbi:MAG TPA: hypothetical protein VFS43_20710 [Polyangiaceae bacterium]|nr:hypothetical protein [Polyangiaceae bacterium]